MIELELLGADGDRVVMTDRDGQRYAIVVDAALRAAVRRARPAALVPAPEPPAPGAVVRPRDLQALMRAGASAEEVAQAAGMDVAHVRRFEGPVTAERAWAVSQAQACRIGWEKDSPVLGELVVDRLATRGVEPSSLQWDALREGREPWQVVLTFVQGAENKQARWELDLAAHSVSAMDEESRWLTEAAAAPRMAEVFDQDSSAVRASSRPQGTTPAPEAPHGHDRAVQEAGPEPGAAESAGGSADAAASPTEALLADLASNRGRRTEVVSPVDDEEGAEAQGPVTSPYGNAQVVSMQERRRALTGSHPAGSRLPHGRSAASTPVSAPSPGSAAAEPGAASQASGEGTTQDTLPDMPAAPEPKPKRRARRSVPSWDEIVFGSKPE
ncbi:septation protein SepH [Actinomyces respiraculi]|uniref:septation protein SepH n=1 Tax=Actinomyces respiraculi TaxID=2744574 RepID=UPI00141FE005|nr:septation protein SepH [Actinomyces respiraculi]